MPELAITLNTVELLYCTSAAFWDFSWGPDFAMVLRFSIIFFSEWLHWSIYSSLSFCAGNCAYLWGLIGQWWCNFVPPVQFCCKMVAVALSFPQGLLCSKWMSVRGLIWQLYCTCVLSSAALLHRFTQSGQSNIVTPSHLRQTEWLNSYSIHCSEVKSSYKLLLL